MQSTPDASNRILCRLFKPFLHSGDMVRHRALPVSFNRHDYGAPQWVNYVENFGVQVELGFCSIIDDQRNCNDVNICQLPVLGTKPNSKI